MGKQLSGADIEVTDESILIGAANPLRDYLFVQNKGASKVYVHLDSAVPEEFANCIVLEAGQYWEPYIAPINAVYAQAEDSATCDVLVLVAGG